MTPESGWYEAGPRGVPGPPSGWDAADQVRWGREYIDAAYGPGGVSGYARGGIILNDPGPHGDEVPLLLSGGCDYVLPLMRWATALLCSYEVAAIATGRVPTLTQVCGRRRWLGPVLVGALAVHLYRQPGRTRQ